MPSVLVLGPQGMLGRAVAAELRAAGLDVLAPARSEFDARRDDPAALPRTDWVVNAIGLLRSRIDEGDPASVRAAFEVNAEFPRRLADTGARIVHITTDAVFSGTGGAPYDEQAPHDAVDACHGRLLSYSVVGRRAGTSRAASSTVRDRASGPATTTAAARTEPP